MVLLLGHKTDAEEEMKLEYDVTKNEEIIELHSGNHGNFLNAVQNLTQVSLLCEHDIETYDKTCY